MKKIAIITPFLANGGLEKVAVVEVEELSKYFDVTLIVMDTFHIDYPYSGKMIDLHVLLMDRGLFKRLYNITMATLKLKRLKKKHCFDLVISHGELANLPNVFSGGKNSILVVHENRFAAIKDIQGKLVNRVIKYIYSARSVSKIVTVSEGIRESFVKKLGINQDAIMTIYNPYNVDEIKTSAREELGEFTSLFSHQVLTITGRLTIQKGQWFLLRIFKELKKLIPDLKLVILGDGEIKEKLIDLSEKLDLKTYSSWSENLFDDSYDVYFMGFQKNPFKFVGSSKLFVMTSLWEGFGNTIVEAMACGTPVVSTNCKSGPGEIICPALENETLLSAANFEGYGVLMPVFTNAFVEADEPLDEREQLWIETLHQLLNDDAKLAQYSKDGIQRAEDFRVDVIMKEWKNLINSILNDNERQS
ncbi:glycosyltransferase [Sulfurovum sp.]|uniref:glycosyltransferase n=1 Tax=Sulfurovum sp. TaxID=1969726 RepID=UPI003567C4AD